MLFPYEELTLKLEKFVILSEREKLHKNPIPKLVASIPYLCSFPDADQFSAINLMTYVLGSKVRDIFNFRFADSAYPEKRFLSYNKPQTNYDNRIFALCLNLMILASLADHQMDKEDDLRSDKLNPLNDYGWDYEELRKYYVDAVQDDLPWLKQAHPTVFDEINFLIPITLLSDGGDIMKWLMENT